MTYIHVQQQSERIHSNMLTAIISGWILGNFFYLCASSIYPYKNIPHTVCVTPLPSEKKSVLIVISQTSKYAMNPFIRCVYQGADLSKSIVHQIKNR